MLLDRNDGSIGPFPLLGNTEPEVRTGLLLWSLLERKGIMGPCLLGGTLDSEGRTGLLLTSFPPPFRLLELNGSPCLSLLRGALDSVLVDMAEYSGPLPSAILWFLLENNEGSMGALFLLLTVDPLLVGLGGLELAIPLLLELELLLVGRRGLFGTLARCSIGCLPLTAAMLRNEPKLFVFLGRAFLMKLILSTMWSSWLVFVLWLSS